MAKRKQSKGDKLETFYFEVSNWSREYRYGINRHPWEFSPGHFDEHDLIVIQGALRNQTPRKFRQCEFHLLPSLVSREERSDDAEQVGNVWIKDDTLGMQRLDARGYVPLPPGHLGSGKGRGSERYRVQPTVQQGVYRLLSAVLQPDGS